MTEFVPPEYQPLVDWCTQPAPAFVGDTHALHFWIYSTQGITYQGLMFFQPVVGTAGPFHGPHFVGTGAIWPTGPWATILTAGQTLPANWIRIAIALTPGVLADLTWFGDDPNTDLPGAQVGWEEENVTNFGGSPGHWTANIGGWTLTLGETTVLVN